MTCFVRKMPHLLIFYFDDTNKNRPQGSVCLYGRDDRITTRNCVAPLYKFRQANQPSLSLASWVVTYRTCGILLPKNLGVPVSAYFRPFPPLSARKHILSGALTSTVSVYSGRVCGINCGQAKHLECSSRRIRGVFSRLYGNSVRPKSQGLSQNKFCPAVNKEKAREQQRVACDLCREML